MKKKLLPLSLIACFTAVSLTACGNAWLKSTDNGQVVLTIDGTEYTTDELFDQFKTSNATGVAAYYNAISEVLIRNATREYAQSTELERIVNDGVERIKEEARDNAATNGTSYKTELDALLENEGVENLTELEEKLTYAELQSHLQDEYYDEHTDELLSDYLDTRLPYHVRHILVNVSAASGTLYNGTITQNEAMNLASVVRRIANLMKDGSVKTTTETFGEVALDASEDDGSAVNYGDLDVMTATTNFVNEFKLGIYAYEALYAGKDTEGRGDYFTDNTIDPDSVMDLKLNAFAIPEEAQDAWKAREESISDGTGTAVRRENGIGYIPFSATQKLEDYADVTTDKNNKQVNDGDADYYPRNIYFNHYFNDHGINVITNDVEVGNFKIIEGLFDGKAVLCADGDPSKVVLVTRAGSSYQGVHFMVVEKSAIGETHETLATYYDNRTPAQLRRDDVADLIGKTYVTFINSSDTQTYSTRSTLIENEVKGFDTMMDTRLFEYYLQYSSDEVPAVKIADADLEAKLFEYIEINRAKAKSDNIVSNEQSWDAYIKLLETQDWLSERKVSLVCAEKFNDGFTEGDGCYVQK